MKKILFAALILLCVSPALCARADTNENMAFVYNYITETLGYNRAAACGIMANIQYESNFRPAAVGDGGNAYGVCQWNSRRQSLINYCTRMYAQDHPDEAENPDAWQILEYQLGYMGYELLNNKKSVGAYLKNVPDTAQGAYDAAYYFCVYFEIPASRYTKGVTRGKTAVTKYFTMYGGTYETYTLTYDGMGGGGVPASQSKLEGVPLTLSNDIPVLPGYAFLGWSMHAGASQADYQPGDSFTVNADSILFAVWSRTEQSDLVYSVDEGGAWVTGYTGTGTQITIPSFVDSNPVVGIEFGAFTDCTENITVYIPESVAYIDECAFNPGTVIASYPGSCAHTFAFEHGYRFISVLTGETLYISGNITVIGDEAFAGTMFSGADLSSSCVTYIGSGAFASCPYFTVIVLPAGVTYIAPDAFEEGVLISAPEGSYARKFAAEYGFSFVPAQ